MNHHRQETDAIEQFPHINPNLPLLIEAIIGWREWRVIQNPSGQLRLSAISTDDIWPPYEPMVASHTIFRSITAGPGMSPQQIYVVHHEMMPHCTCGIHALKDLNHLAELMDMVTTMISIGALDPGETRCYGAVAIWGTVCEHQYGYRAQYAYPQPPLVVLGPPEKTGPAALALRETYGLEFRAPGGLAEAMLILTQGANHGHR
jgi:hypothetical protein